MGGSGPRDQCHWVRVSLLDFDSVNARYADTDHKNQRQSHLVARRKLAKSRSERWRSEAAGRATFRKVYNGVWHERIMPLRATAVLKRNVAIAFVHQRVTRQQHPSRQECQSVNNAASYQSSESSVEVCTPLHNNHSSCDSEHRHQLQKNIAILGVFAILLKTICYNFSMSEKTLVALSTFFGGKILA